MSPPRRRLSPSRGRRSPRKIDRSDPRPLGPGRKRLTVWADPLTHWPLLLLASATGAILALAFSLVRPPNYEAEAVLPISIDYGRTQPLELIVEDRLLDRVWAHFTSDIVVNDAVARLAEVRGEAAPLMTADAFRANSRLEARLSRWTFIGSSSIPGEAADMANAWADAAATALETALDHAWRAVELQRGTFYATCIQLLEVPTRTGFWECFSRGPNVDADQVVTLRAEIEAAHGISPMLSHEPVERAIPPSGPVVYERGWLIMAGTLIGLLSGIGGLALFRPLPPGRPKGA